MNLIDTKPKVKALFDFGQKAISTYVVADNAYRVAKKAYNDFQAKRRYTVSIDQGDELFHYVQLELLKNTSLPEVKTLHASARREGTYGQREYTLAKYYDGKSSLIVKIGDHNVKVNIEAGKESADSTSTSSNSSTSIIKRSLKIESKNFEAHQEVLKFLESVVKTQMESDDGNKFYTRRWSEWNLKSSGGTRSIESVILKEGQKENLLNDIEKFLSQEETYVSMGIPYHRGYLLYGPPGTGKTSLIKSVAHHLNLDVYYLNLSEVLKDSDLIDLLADVDSGSIVLMEDIDSAKSAKVRDESEENRGVTTAGLLNALDGLTTPDGVIFFMTTNHIEKLDPAVLRSGRIDFKEEISLTDDTQFRNIVRFFTGQDYTGPTRPMPPSEIMETIKRNLDTPHLTLKAIEELVTND